MQAISAPLQERVPILDLDNDRANAIPEYYDTDLESEWSNQSNRLRNNTSVFVCVFVCHFDLELFDVDGDSSWSSIQRGRNRYYQRKIVS